MKGQAVTPDPTVSLLDTGAEMDTPRGVRQVSSHDLFDGKREVIIAHGEERYRLCITASNKLILIK
ncbi:MAG: hemin uptake protein HemP [Pseudomonadota bacterium]